MDGLPNTSSEEIPSTLRDNCTTPVPNSSRLDIFPASEILNTENTVGEPKVSSEDIELGDIPTAIVGCPMASFPPIPVGESTRLVEDVPNCSPELIELGDKSYDREGAPKVSALPIPVGLITIVWVRVGEPNTSSEEIPLGEAFREVDGEPNTSELEIPVGLITIVSVRVGEPNASDPDMELGDTSNLADGEPIASELSIPVGDTENEIDGEPNAPELETPVGYKVEIPPNQKSLQISYEFGGDIVCFLIGGSWRFFLRCNQPVSLGAEPLPEIATATPVCKLLAHLYYWQ